MESLNEGNIVGLLKFLPEVSVQYSHHPHVFDCTCSRMVIDLRLAVNKETTGEKFRGAMLFS